MSRTEIYAVRPEDGDIELEAEISNSWRGAMHVWQTLAECYGITPPGQGHLLTLREPLMKKLWALGKDDRLAWWERVVLLSTFDRVVILRPDFDRLIEAFDKWTQHQGIDNSLWEQRASFVQIRDHERPFRGLCFNQTSVCANPWWVYDNSGEDEEGRPFNIDRDTDWWSLFDAYPSLRAEAISA